MNNSDNMKGLFFIVKGQYSKGVEPSFVNKVTNDTNYIGGYDPYNDNTSEWYMLLDCKTFNCVSCGSDFNKVLKGVYNVIKKYRGVARNYFKHVSSVTSDDYYETHYLGKSPLTHDQRVKKAEGRCPRVSPAMRELYQHIYDEFGDYYEEEVREMEERAYSELTEDTPLKKAKKLMSRTKTQTPPKTPVETPKKEMKREEVAQVIIKKRLKPKLGLGSL